MRITKMNCRVQFTTYNKLLIGACVLNIFFLLISILQVRAQGLQSPRLGTDVSVVAAKVTGATSKQVFDFLKAAAPLRDLPASQFVKLEILFLKPTLIDQIRIETCGEAFQDGIDFYVNFDESFYFLEGGKNFVSFENTKAREVEALTINFRRNSGLCLKNIVFKQNGQTLSLRAPILIDAKPDLSKKNYQSLFDSKLNSYVKIISVDERPVMTFAFKSPLQLDQMMIWPGNFTTDLIFKKYSRLKNFDFQCDRGPLMSLELKDELSPQLIKVTDDEKLSCQKINLRLNSVYQGSAFAELALTELRFLKDGQVYLPDISEFEKRDQQKIQTELAGSGLLEMLSRQLISVETKTPFVMRLHPDGTFFLHGVDELAKENTSFYILGDFVPESIKKDRIKLKLRGIKRSSTIEMDSLSCGRKCFSANDFSLEKYYFEQEIQIRKGKDKFYRIDTVAEKKLRRIDFTGVRFLIDHSL
jgi:hypothetical protein